MDFLYSLYDALVSINVPNDRARAVVDAMERDMGTTLATKTDLLLLKHEMVLLRQELKQDVAETNQRIDMLRKDMELLRTSMTVRLGSIQVVAATLLFTALKLS